MMAFLREGEMKLCRKEMRALPASIMRMSAVLPGVMQVDAEGVLSTYFVCWRLQPDIYRHYRQ